MKSPHKWAMSIVWTAKPLYGTLMGQQIIALECIFPLSKVKKINSNPAMTKSLSHDGTSCKWWKKCTFSIAFLTSFSIKTYQFFLAWWWYVSLFPFFYYPAPSAGQGISKRRWRIGFRGQRFPFLVEIGKCNYKDTSTNKRKHCKLEAIFFGKCHVDLL